MDSIDITKKIAKINAASGRGNANSNQAPDSYQRHGRTTAIDDHSDLQVLKRIKRYLLPKDFVISQGLLEEMVAGYDIGDPVADALAADGIRFAKPLQQFIISGSNSGSNFDANLTNNPAFNALTEQFSSHPTWFDPKLAQIGAVAYRRYPLMLIWLLRNVALMAGYSIPALSLPHIQTGALMHDALPRLMRTYAYILAVSEHPPLHKSNMSAGNQRQPIEQVLAIGSEGWQQSIKVRQIHTLVRQNLLKGKGNAA